MKTNSIAIFVSPHIGKYGAERSMITIMKALKTKGVVPFLIIPKKGTICEILSELHISYKVVPFKNWINIGEGTHYIKGIFKFIINKKLAAGLKKKFAGENVTFIHTNSIITSFGWQFAKKIKVPHIQHIREFADKDFDMCFDVGKRFSLKMVSKYSTQVICVSEELKEYYKGFLKKGQCVRIYNGISSLNKNIKRYDNSFNIVMVGRLTNEKRHIDLLKAIEKMKEHKIDNFNVDIYGDGINKNYLEKYVEEHELYNLINFKGFQSNIIYTNYDVGIIASPNEAFGRVTVEYMINGLAVIGAEGGGTKEIIINNQTGLLYKAGDFMDLCDSIERLYYNRGLIKKYGEQGKKRAEEYFSEKIYLNNIVNVYQQFNLLI